MNNQPLVSVIMNCYNGEKYLAESLKSLLKQTYQNWELIFWDNLSTDNSKKIFENYKDKRFKYFLAENHTLLYHARNLAIQKTSGDFIAFLDTDDFWLEDKLRKQIKLFTNKNVGLVYGNYWRYDKSNFFKKKKLAISKQLPSGMITDKLLSEYFIGIGTAVIRKKFIDEKEKIFDTEFDMLADMDFILRFSKKFEFDCVQEPVQVHRLHAEQLQNKKMSEQGTQFSKWYEKIKSSNEFGSEEKLIAIKNRSNFFKIIKYIDEKFYFKSLKEIIFYPNNLDKIKLFFILIVPKKISNRILHLR